MQTSEAKEAEKVNVRLWLTPEENERVTSVKRSLDFKKDMTHRKMELQHKIFLKGLEAYETELKS